MPTTMPSLRRRAFLKMLSGTALTTLVSRSGISRATPSEEQKFIFVLNPGGWDPTRVFATVFDNPAVSMELLSEPLSSGGLQWVSHPDRPSVDSFFQAYGSSATIVNGMQVRSIAHEICRTLMLTGGTSGQTADWATILAAEAAGDYAIPHLNLSSLQFSGPYASEVVQTGTNNQLAGLLSRDLIANHPTLVDPLSQPALDRLDRHLRQRIGAHERDFGVYDNRSGTIALELAAAWENAERLQAARHEMDFSSGSTLASQIGIGVEALAKGMSRCVTLSHTGNGLGWDSHADNDTTQSPLFETLFDGLLSLQAMLTSTTGSDGRMLSEQTTVVVLSEMGRTPQLNGTNGKDHWPFTSALIVGPATVGGRVIGGFDAGYQGLGVDYATAEVGTSAPICSVESVGAALLTLGDVDPSQYIPDASPLLGMLL